MYFQVINRTEGFDKNNDPYVVVNLESSKALIKSVGGVELKINVPSKKVTVVVYLNRDNMNAARKAAGLDPIVRPEFYGHLGELPVEEWTEGTVLTIEHEAIQTVIGDKRFSISQTELLVNSTPDALDFNAMVAAACKWRGIKPLNPAFQSKNKALGEVKAQMPVGMNTGEE